MAPHVLPRLRESLALLASRPWVSMLLGLSLLLSLGSVCCGLGLVAAPWFACELAAVQLGFLVRERVPRTWSWVGAGLVQAVAVVVISAAAALGVTWMGLGAPLADGAFGSPTTIVPPASLALAALSGASAALYLLPFLFAPLILLDRGGSPGDAILDSVHLVATGGVLAHFRFSVAAHGIQLAPTAVAILVAVVFMDAAIIPVAIVIALPLSAAAVVIGQGMISSAYVARRDELPARPCKHPSFSALHIAAALGLAVVAIAPSLALLFVTGSLVARPARPDPGRAPDGEVLAVLALSPEAAQPLRLPGTSLEIRASEGALSVVAGDGGGAGAIPLPTDRPLEQLRVVRSRDLYALELSSDGRSYVTRVTRAGVRVDDGLTERLSDHLSPGGLLSLFLALVAVPLLLVFCLAPYGQLRRLRPGTDPSDPKVRRLRKGAHRRTILALALLLPLSALCLFHASRALL